MAQSPSSMNAMKLAGAWCCAALLAAAVVVNRDALIEMASDYVPKQSDKASVARADADTGGAPRRSADRTVELRANRSGHFEARVSINGRSIEAMVDTGATVVVLTYEDARTAGIFVGPADFKHSVATANGSARVAQVMLDSVSIDDIVIRNVQAMVSEAGKMNTSLLGMSFLGRLGKAEMSRGLLILKE